MAQKIVKQFSVEHVVKGLEKALNNSIKLQAAGANNAEQIKEIKAELDSVKLEPETSEEALKIYEDRLKKFHKANSKAALDSMKGVGSVSKKQAEEVQNEMEEVEKKLEDLEKDKGKIDKKFQVQEDGSFGASRSGDLYKKEVAPIVDKKMGKDSFVNPFTGKVLTDAANYTKQMEKLDTALEGQTETDKKLIAGIKKKVAEKKGFADLSQKEIKYLQKIKKQNGDIAISEKEIFKQMKTQQKLYKVEKDALEKLYNAEVENINVQKKALEKKRSGFTEFEADFKKKVKNAENLTEQEKNANEELNAIRNEETKGIAKVNEKQKERTKSQREATKQTKNNTKATKINTSTLGQATKQVFNYGIAFTALRRIYRETISTVKNLDKALTEMSIVTSMNRKES